MLTEDKTPPPKIEFPCANYSIKVIGHKTSDFKSWVIDTVSQYAPDLEADKVMAVDSRNGLYQSVRLAICAQSQEQLQTLHQELMESGKVKVVL